MTPSAVNPEPVIAVTSPADDMGRRGLRAYFDDVASSYYGRQATDDEIAAAIRESPSDDLAPPAGLLLVASAGGNLQGCAGLRLVPGHAGNLAEVTRVYVVPAARDRGLGARLLNALEEHARELGVTTLRLDTRKDLTEARRLYARHGYHEVAPFNNEKYADHWFEKTCSAAPPEHASGPPTMF